MNFFCTLFDSKYIHRGLALYESLSKNCKSFQLYIVAFDNKCESVLKHLNLENCTIIGLDEFEDDELLKVKSTRNYKEYLWTSTSSVILYTIKRYDLPYCTYLDADTFFFGSPEPLHEEMGEKSILITEHRYTLRYYRAFTSGKYCVQFITFKNDSAGLEVLQWWRKACHKCCYDRVENGKFGDQKYLDDWTVRFKGVHVLKHLGGGVAPWNVQQFKIWKDVNGIQLKKKRSNKIYDLIFYHFHNMKFYPERIDLGLHRLPKSVIDTIYAPYIRRIEEINRRLVRIDSSLEVSQPFSEKRRSILQQIEAAIKGWRNNIYKKSYFSYQNHG